MNKFTITIRTSSSTTRYFAIAMSSHSAYMDAVKAQGDAPCGITVIPA